MATRLYVGNLSFSTTSVELQELFEQFGVVGSAQVLSDRETGRSRGFGFVEMDNDAEAEAAIAPRSTGRVPSGASAQRERSPSSLPA